MMDPRATVLSVTLMVLVGGCSSDSPAECADDSDCSGGYFCRNNKCDFDCRDDNECPEGFYCTARGRCERGCAETNGGIEACDGIDNDCDDSTDEEFPLLGEACSNQGCPGVWVCSNDGRQAICDGPFPAEDDQICDGLDEDCDGATDEDALPVDCPLQDGVCAGVRDVCRQTGQWSGCDYGSGYTEGIDQACDQIDSDCDGDIDEDASFLLAAESGPQASDGLDNNCNGLIDEPGGVMVPIPLYPTKWIDAYETAVFENPDCSGRQYGIGSDDYPAGWPIEGQATQELYSCSLAGVIPSGYLSWYRAKWACQAQGKRLCTIQDWGAACTGGTAMFYPYGPSFVPGICNDAWGGAGQVAQTGSYQDCFSQARIFDASGNLLEWVEELSTTFAGNAHVGGSSYECELCRYGVECFTCDVDEPQHLELVEGVSDCPIGINNDWNTYPVNDAKAYMGTRCCFDFP